MSESLNRVSNAIELRERNLQISEIADQMECSERTVRRLLEKGSRAEQRIVEFEAMWRERKIPKIEDYVPSQGNPTRAEILEELVCVDMEYRWRNGELSAAARGATGLGAKPIVEDYVSRFPELSVQDVIPANLLMEEFRIRSKWGDRLPNYEEYQERFPRRKNSLTKLLESVDDDLAAEQNLDAPPPSPTPPSSPPPAPPASPVMDSGSSPTLDIRPSVAKSDSVHSHSRSEKYTSRKEPKKGGMAVVWRAFDSRLQREVAYKTLRADRATDREYLTMFLHEAQVTGQLEHPNIVPVYELGGDENDDGPFYTMKYVHGGTLSDAIKHYQDKRRSGQSDRRDLDRLLNTFLDACHAIQYAHSRGVLHRDIKPDNIMVGDYGEVLVVDWGLAKVLGVADADLPAVRLTRADQMFTNVGERKGTPDYWAPEQAEGRGDLVDCRTDIYGLGGVLFEILTGNAPNAQENDENTTIEIVGARNPRDVVSSAPPALSAICQKALSRHRSDRYAKVDELISDIESWRVDEPVSAYRETFPERVMRQVRRNMVASVVTGVGFLAVLLVLASLHFTDKNNAKEIMDREIDTLSQFASSQEAKLMAQIDVLRHDVSFLAALDQVQTVFNGAEGSNDQRQELEKIFARFLGQRPEYMQLRLIRRNGKELVRVQRDRPDGLVVVVPDEKLQNKGGRGYFVETLSKRKGEWFLSGIELNQENGKKDKELPVIRGAVPVFAAEDETGGSEVDSLVGIVIINLHFRKLVDDLREFEEQTSSGLVYLTDAEGRFLYHPNKDIAFAFERDLEYRIQQLYTPLKVPYDSGLKHFIELDATPQVALFAKPDPDYMRHGRAFEPINQRMVSTLISIGIENESVKWHTGNEGDAIVYGVEKSELHAIGEQLNENLPIKMDLRIIGANLDGDKQAVHYNRLNLEPGNEQRSLGLALVVPHESLEASSNVTRMIFWVTLALLACGIVSLVYFIARRTSNRTALPTAV